MPKLLNKYRDHITAGSVYIGRPSEWGNPFIVGVDGSREEVIAMYERRLSNDNELRSRVKACLRGKDLVCFCSPRPCHGDVLLRVANED